MGNVYFCSDLHLLHKSIDRYRWDLDKEGSGYNDQVVMEQLRTIKKNDTLYVLGDVDFSKEGIGLLWLNLIKCRKILIKGNHDTLPLKKYLEVFDEIYGLLFKYGLQFSHAPVHPKFLRGKINVHGHTHDKNVKTRNWLGIKKDDPRYFNICPENLAKVYRRSDNLASTPPLLTSNMLLSLDQLRRLVWPKAMKNKGNTK